MGNAADIPALDLLEAAPTPTAVVDRRDGSMRLLNRRFRELFGWSVVEVPTLDDWWRLACPDPEYRKAVRTEWERSVATGAAVQDIVAGPDYAVRTKFGRTLEVVISRSVVGDFVVSAITDVTQRRREEDRLRIAEDKLEVIFERVPIGWAEVEMVFDADGTPVDYIFRATNAAFQEFTGMDRFGVLGRRVTELIPGIRDAEPDLISLYGDVVAQQSERHFELFFQPFGRWYSVTAFPRGGNRLVQMFEEISGRKAAERAMEAANDELRRSNEELEQFAFVASHDLQEPLRMVASYTELLAKRYSDRFDEAAQRYMGYAVDGAKRMQALINDLLAFSRITTQARPAEPTDIGEVIAEQIDNLAVAIDEAGATVTVEGEMPTLPVDRRQIGQVFQNLIANGIKFRGADPPHVRIGATRIDKAEPIWEFSVSDNGIGIAPEYHDRVFAVFKRLHTRGTYPGTGIGLSVVKKVIDRHGGTIRIESEEGRGATFVFTLPEAPASALTEEAINGHPPRDPDSAG
jgi:signal transduction histidine kinase